MIKLIATDLDGTLLDQYGNIPNDLSEIIKTASKKHIKFVIASEKSYCRLKRDFKAISDHITFIADNGATIIENNKMIYCDTLDKELVKNVIHKYRKNKDSYIILSCKETAYIECDEERFVNEVDKYYYQRKLVNNLEEVEDDVIKISLCNFDNAKILSNKFFDNEIKNNLEIIILNDIWIDVLANGVNKGKSLQIIQDKYAITMGETMVFGDSYTDIPMFQKAYYIYATDNAPEAIKIKSKKIAPSNAENGVISVIKSTINLYS